jgi:hypothetical protein
MDQELELLRTAPSPSSFSVEPPAYDHRGKNRESDDMWKLDSPTQSRHGKGPLLGPSGKVNYMSCLRYVDVNFLNLSPFALSPSFPLEPQTEPVSNHKYSAPVIGCQQCQ